MTVQGAHTPDTDHTQVSVSTRLPSSKRRGKCVLGTGLDREVDLGGVVARRLPRSSERGWAGIFLEHPSTSKHLVGPVIIVGAEWRRILLAQRVQMTVVAVFALAVAGWPLGAGYGRNDGSCCGDLSLPAATAAAAVTRSSGAIRQCGRQQTDSPSMPPDQHAVDWAIAEAR